MFQRTNGRQSPSYLSNWVRVELLRGRYPLSWIPAIRQPCSSHPRHPGRLEYAFESTIDLMLEPKVMYAWFCMLILLALGLAR